jgi:hypothetical protein
MLRVLLIALESLSAYSALEKILGHGDKSWGVR